jgi:hypothetical protein
MSDCHSTSSSTPSPALLPVYRKLGFTRETLPEFLNSLSLEYKETSGRLKEGITHAEFRKCISRVLKDPENLEHEWLGAFPHFKGVIDQLLPGDNGDVLIAEQRHDELLDAFKQVETEYADPNLRVRCTRSPEDKAKWMLVSRIMDKYMRSTGRLPTIDGRGAAKDLLSDSALFETFLRAVMGDLGIAGLPAPESLLRTARRQLTMIETSRREAAARRSAR